MSTQKLRWPLQWTRHEELFLFASLMLLTCYFLPWRGSDEAERSPWQLLSQSNSLLTTIPWVSVLLLVCLTPVTVREPRVRPWFGIAAALAVNAALAVGVLFGNAYGAHLAQFFALAILVMSANPAILKTGDLAMRKLNSRKAEVFTHWGTVLDGVQFSAQEFYARLEAEIQARQWPGVEVLRVPFTEAGLLSHKREYFRVVRQRQVVDICASSFGRDYFFTMREAEIQAQLTLATLIIFTLGLFLVLGWMIRVIGFLPGLIAFCAMLVFGVLLLLNVLRMGLTRLDGLLLRTPVIGPIYETWFRRSSTYFQHDTRVVFLKLMDDLMKAHVDEETSAKGVKLLPCFEHQPILDGLYKTSTRDVERGEGE